MITDLTAKPCAQHFSWFDSRFAGRGLFLQHLIGTFTWVMDLDTSTITVDFFYCLTLYVLRLKWVKLCNISKREKLSSNFIFLINGLNPLKYIKIKDKDKTLSANIWNVNWKGAWEFPVGAICVKKKDVVFIHRGQPWIDCHYSASARPFHWNDFDFSASLVQMCHLKEL